MAFRAPYRRPVTFDGQAFGRRVAAARVWRGLEPKQVAAHLGVSAEAINRWERGGLQRAPARGQLRLLAEVLEQPEEWIAGGEAPPWAAVVDRGAGTDRERDDLEAERHQELLEHFAAVEEQLRELSRRTPARTRSAAPQDG